MDDFQAWLPVRCIYPSLVIYMPNDTDPNPTYCPPLHCIAHSHLPTTNTTAIVNTTAVIIAMVRPIDSPDLECKFISRGRDRVSNTYLEQ